MTSMIDVVFLLLVFFVWTSSFDLPETNLPGSLAMAAKPEEPPDAVRPTDTTPSSPIRNPEVVVQILADNASKSSDKASAGSVSYRVGAIELPDISAVEAKLSRIAGLPISPTVIIDPEDSVSVADSIKIFDLARRLGFSRVLLAVEEPG
jgi:biopolymer transport protein ExbD